MVIERLDKVIFEKLPDTTMQTCEPDYIDCQIRTPTHKEMILPLQIFCSLKQ